MELTDMVKNHKLHYEGNWDKLRCSKCHQLFHIRKDMCDAEGITEELRRINKLPCKQ